MQLQEIDEYRWSGIDEPPETRGKGKERGKKRKVLNRKISEESGSWRKRGMTLGFKGFVPALLQVV